jgi:hypothetical protein
VSAVAPPGIDAGVVHEDVDAAPEHLLRLGRKLLGGLQRSVEVGGDELGVPGRLSDLFDDRLPAPGAAASHGDLRSFGGERHRDGAANVAGGAGDERCLAVQPCRHGRDLPLAWAHMEIWTAS